MTKLTSIPDEYNFDSRGTYEKLNQAILSAVGSANKKRESKLREALAEHGFIFERYEDFINFASRCEIEDNGHFKILIARDKNGRKIKVCAYTDVQVLHSDNYDTAPTFQFSFTSFFKKL